MALRKGSFVVNSSQGGGSKDTWVLAAEDGAMRQSMGKGSMTQMLGSMTQSFSPKQRDDDQGGQQ